MRRKFESPFNQKQRTGRKFSLDTGNPEENTLNLTNDNKNKSLYKIEIINCNNAQDKVKTKERVVSSTKNMKKSANNCMKFRKIRQFESSFNQKQKTCRKFSLNASKLEENTLKLTNDNKKKTFDEIETVNCNNTQDKIKTKEPVVSTTKNMNESGTNCMSSRKIATKPSNNFYHPHLKNSSKPIDQTLENSKCIKNLNNSFYAKESLNSPFSQSKQENLNLKDSESKKLPKLSQKNRSEFSNSNFSNTHENTSIHKDTSSPDFLLNSGRNELKLKCIICSKPVLNQIFNCTTNHKLCLDCRNETKGKNLNLNYEESFKNLSICTSSSRFKKSFTPIQKVDKLGKISRRLEFSSDAQKIYKEDSIKRMPNQLENNHYISKINFNMSTKTPIQTFYQESGIRCGQLNIKNEIECFSCKKVLKTDKNRGSKCETHYFCNICITKPTNLDQLKNSCNNCYSEFEEFLRNSGKKVYCERKPVFSFDNPKAVIPSSYLKEQEEVENKLKFEGKGRIDTSKSPATRSNNERNTKVEIQKTNEYKDFNQSHSSSCAKCTRKPSDIKLSCTHYVCFLCLTINCCSNIKDFFSSYEDNKSIIYSHFSYICPLDHCKKKISYSTQKVIEKFIYFTKDPQYKKYFKGIEINFKNSDPWFSYFDGKPYYEAFSNYFQKDHLICSKNELDCMKTDLLNDNHSKLSNKNNSIILSMYKCIKCQSNKPEIGFLCNHSVCKLCLTYSCCSSINDFFSRPFIFPEFINYSFAYYCPVEDCGMKISVPTAMIIKNYIDYSSCSMTSERFKVFNLKNIMKDLSLLISYFDGLPFDFN